MGALGAALAGISVIGVVPIIGVAFALVTGFIFGASFGLVPAVLKVKLGVNEIIVTVLLNFVALLFISYLLHGPIKGPGFNPYSPEIFPQSQTANHTTTYSSTCRNNYRWISNYWNVLTFIKN